MDSLTLNCPTCNQTYSEYRQPKVLPCGHSLCSLCIGEASYYVFCGYCHTKYDEKAIVYTPTNLLYFEMLEKIAHYIKQKQWESPLKNINEGESNQERQTILRLQQQCLYTFCQRRRYERQGNRQLFCSQQCKNNHQLLQQA